MDIELLASALIACLEYCWGDVLGQRISHMEVTLPAPQVQGGLRIVEDSMSVNSRYGIELLSFMGGRYNKFSCPQQVMGVQLASQKSPTSPSTCPLAGENHGLIVHHIPNDQPHHHHHHSLPYSSLGHEGSV